MFFHDFFGFNPNSKTTYDVRRTYMNKRQQLNYRPLIKDSHIPNVGAKYVCEGSLSPNIRQWCHSINKITYLIQTREIDTKQKNTKTKHRPDVSGYLYQSTNPYNIRLSKHFGSGKFTNELKIDIV